MSCWALADHAQANLAMPTSSRGRVSLIIGLRRKNTPYGVKKGASRTLESTKKNQSQGFCALRFLSGTRTDAKAVAVTKVCALTISFQNALAAQQR